VNLTSLRPVERVAASLVSWLGGGVQPSNRGRVGMFCDASPIWTFLNTLGAIEDPEEARDAIEGLYLMEVFPAIAMPSLSPEFLGRLSAPRYNPGRKKTFRLADWVKVASALTARFEEFAYDEAAHWIRDAAAIPRVTKADQDRLDAMVCLWIALHWRLRDRKDSLIIGSMDDGYMVMPAVEAVRLRLAAAAERTGVNFR
jgi:predicted RNase H-like nuclease